MPKDKIKKLDTHKKIKSAEELNKRKHKDESSFKKTKDKEKSKKSEKVKKDKKTNKSKEDAPKKKRGRPFGAKTVNKAPIDTVGYSQLSADAQRIYDLLEIKENEGAITLTQKAMLQTVIKMMPVAEQKYYEFMNDRAVYAFNALVTQARELIADVQAGQDKSKVLDNVLYNLIQPQIKMFANFLLGTNHQLKKEIKKLVKEKYHKELDHVIDESVKSMGSYAQEMFNDLKERLPTALD